MSHLSPDDLIEALGPDVAPGAARHLADCEHCRRQVEDLKSIRAAVEDVDVPEPTPVFWARFAARVAHVTSAVPPRRKLLTGVGLGTRWGWSLGAAAVIVLALAAGAVLRRSPHVEPPDFAMTRGSALQPLVRVPEPAAPDDESPWELVADANEGMDWEAVEAAGLSPAPGSADRAVMELSAGERSELVKLLKAELAGSSI